MLRLLPLLFLATAALAELRLGPEIAIGEVGREILAAQNSRPAIATDGKETLVFWAAQVLNRPGALLASRLGTNEVFRLAEDVRSFRNDVAAFHIDDAYIVVFLAGQEELRALRFSGEGQVETLSIAKHVRNYVAASNGSDVVVAYEVPDGNHAALLRSDLSEVRELGKLYGDLAAVASDGVGYGILTAQGSTLYLRFFDGKNMTERQELLHSGGEFPAIALTASAGTFIAAWQQCVEGSCAVRGARFTRQEFLGALQIDAPRKRAKSRELGITGLGLDALLVWWGESDEYERLQTVLARRVVGTETLDLQPIVLSTHPVGTLLDDHGRLVLADAVVRAATVATPLAKPWPNAKMEVLSKGATFERAEAVAAAGDRLVLVRDRLHKLPPYGSTAATVLERGRARELAIASDLHVVSAASDGRRVAIAGFDGRLNLMFQAEKQKPRVLLSKQNWEQTTAMVWTGDRYLIAFTADRRLRLLEVDRNGKPLAEPREAAPLVTAAEEPIQSHPALARGAGEVLLVWTEGNLFYEGERLVRATRVGRAGEPVILSRNGDLPAAAWNGRAFAVAWTAPSEEPSLRGAILRGTEVTPFELPGSKYAQEPDVVSIGGMFVLACRDYEGGSLTRLGQFDEDGKLLATITTPGGGEHFMQPHLAVTGPRTLALFHTRFAPEEPYGGTYRAFVRFVEVGVRRP